MVAHNNGVDTPSSARGHGPGVPLFDYYTHSQLTDSRGQTPYPGVPA